MRAIAITTPGGPEVLQITEVPRPDARPGRSAHPCGGRRRKPAGRLPAQGRLSPAAGSLAAAGAGSGGTIEEIGPGVSEWKPGDPVCALTPGGGYAEFCVAPAAHCLPVPGGWTMIQAASVPETAFTVWGNVFQRARLRAGERFLVHGGSSGIGVMAIQMAKALGAIPFATAGSEAKCRACVELGAQLAVNHRTQDFVAEILAATDGRGVDVVLDMVAGSYFGRNLQVLAPDGRLIHIATLHGAKVELDLRVIMAKRLTVMGSTLRPQSNAAKADIASALRREVWPHLEAGRIRAVVHADFPLEQAAEAHRLMESGEHIGKIMLRVA